MRNKRLSKVRNVKMGEPTPNILREYIRAGICWWCESGPWKSLAGHTSHGHGITAAEVRAAAYLVKATRLCSPEHSAACAARPQTRANLPAMQASRGYAKERHMSEAGIEIARAKLRRVMGTPEEARELRHRASLRSAALSARPHGCTWCGAPMPRSTPRTCSPECRLSVRRQTARGVTQRRDFAQFRHPHPCPVCHTMVPTSKPLYCCARCRTIAIQRPRSRPPCTVCGKDTGTHRKRTCSPACLAAARRRQGIAYRGNLFTVKADLANRRG